MTLGTGTRLGPYEIVSSLGVGGMGSVSIVPGAIQDAYGDNPVSGMLFVHAELR